MSPALPSHTAERHVRRVHLRATNADAIRRASSTLDDALRTASIPEAESGRLLVIRRLALGRISVNASPTTLSLLVEQVTHIAADRAVCFDDPGANSADALLFPSRADALVELGRRLAQSQAADEWYWSRIVPGWNTAATRVMRWRALLATARELEAPLLIAGALAHEADAGGALGDLIDALRPEDVDVWWFLAGWQPDNGEGTPTDAALLSPRAMARLLELRERFGPHDRRVTWLGAVLVVHDRAYCAGLRGLPQRITTCLQRASIDRGNETPLNAGRRATSALSDDNPAGRRDENTIPISARSHTPELAAGSDAPNPAPEPLREDDNVTTSCAGLFFLVNVLARLRFARFLARRPAMLQAALPARLLRHVACDVRICEDDPVMQLLTAWAGDGDDAPSGGAMTIIPDAIVKAWHTAVRRWCLRHALIEWHALVLRPARVHVTPTHIDVSFAPAQAEVALRCAALDVDPGWVPWLGRVIRFHYLNPDERIG